MRKIVGLALVAALVVNMSGCTPGNNTGGSTVLGAASGGLIGAAVSRGNPFAVAAGAIIGGLVGNQVGQNMDRRDRQNMQQAITTTPVHQQSSWTNTHTETTYTVTPVKEYHRQGQYCREYTTKISVGGHIKNAYGRACRRPDGSWKIIR